MQFLSSISLCTIVGLDGSQLKDCQYKRGKNSGGVHFLMLNPIALRKTKIVHNFGLSECIRVTAPKTCKQLGSRLGSSLRATSSEI